MRYYSRLQRDSEGYAARVFEGLYPNPRSRRAVATFFAQIIRRAAAVTSAWSVTLDPDSIRLNVGPVRLLSLWPDRLWFCIAGDKVADAPRWLRDVSDGPMVYPNSVRVPSRQYEIRADHVSKIPLKIRDRAYQYVDHAAARRTGRSSWERSHSPGVLHFVQAYLGTALPRPAGQGAAEEQTAMPDEIRTPETFVEGSVQRVFVNAYERNPAARSACIKHYGPRCFVCGFDFGATYGVFAEGFIHVHHTKPLATIRTAYKVDPVADLRPVCPNCHAAIHIGNECRAIEELRHAVQASKSPPNSR